MRVDLADDPAVIIVAEGLNLEPDHVVGKLHRLWAWFDKHSEDGNAPGVTYAWLNRYLSVSGIAEVLESAGWLAHDGAVLSIPKFERHNGKSGKSRVLSAKRQANYKSRSGNAKVTPTPLPREEKRRVEKSNKEPPTPLVLPPVLDTQPFRESLEKWFAYKGKPYKPTGLAALVSRAAAIATTHGVAAVIAAMQRAMANGWKGWDQESSFGGNHGKQASRIGPGQKYDPNAPAGGVDRW
jgi:hypothetical protein